MNQSREEVSLTFNGELQLEDLPRGLVLVKCWAFGGAVTAKTHRFLVANDDLSAVCLDPPIIQIPSSRVVLKIAICWYVFTEEDVGEDGSSRVDWTDLLQPMGCFDEANLLHFQDGSLIIDTRGSVPLGLHTIHCKGRNIKETLLIIDDSLMLTCVPPEPFWMFPAADKSIEFYFTLNRDTEWVVVDRTSVEITCKFSNGNLSNEHFNGSLLSLDIVEAEALSMVYSVTCFIYNNVSASLDLMLINQDSLHLTINEQHRLLHLLPSTFIYTCQVKETSLADFNAILETPRWVLPRNFVTPVIGNRLVVDNGTSLGLHDFYCELNVKDRKLVAEKSIMVYNNLMDIRIEVKPNVIILGLSNETRLTANLVWRGNSDNRTRDLVTRMPVTCRVRRQINEGEDVSAGEEIVFNSSILCTSLHVGTNMLTCWNVEAGVHRRFKRTVIHESSLQLSCLSQRAIRLTQMNKIITICERALQRFGPGPSSDDHLVTLVVNCAEATGQLELINGILFLNRPFPQPGIYDVECRDVNWSKPILLYDSSMKLEISPKEDFWILDGFTSITFTFKSWSSNDTDPGTIVPSEETHCWIHLESSKEDEAIQGTTNTVVTDPKIFGSRSAKHAVRCEAFGGDLSIRRPLVMIDPNEVVLSLTGENNTVQYKGTPVAFACYLVKPKVLLDLVQLQWFGVSDVPGFDFYGPRATINDDVPLGHHTIRCGINHTNLQVYVDVGVTIIEPNETKPAVEVTSSGPVISLNGEPFEPATCYRLEGQSNASLFWERLSGQVRFTTQEEKFTENNTNTGLVLRVEADPQSSQISTFRCSARVGAFCASKLVLFARLVTVDNVRLKPVQRTVHSKDQLFFSTGYTLDLLHLEYRVAIGQPVFWQPQPEILARSTEVQHEERVYHHYTVEQTYLGRVVSLSKVDRFSQYKNRINIEFYPRLTSFTESMILECRIMRAGSYASTPYIMVKVFPAAFRPLLYYERIRFDQTFVGGVYTVTCYYVSHHIAMEKISMSFEYTKVPTKITVVQNGYVFACISDGYPVEKVVVRWSVPEDLAFAFVNQGPMLILNNFAPYGNYVIACQVAVFSKRQYYKFNGSLEFQYGETSVSLKPEDDYVWDKSARVKAIWRYLPFLFSIFAWTFCYVSICAVIIYWTHQSRSNGGQTADSKTTKHPEQRLTYTLDELDELVRIRLHRLFREFDSVQQIRQRMSNKTKRTSQRAFRLSNQSVGLSEDLTTLTTLSRNLRTHDHG